MRALGLLLLLCAASIAHAEPLAVANRLRARECPAASSKLTRLKSDSQIEAVVTRWSQGGALAAAIPQGFGAIRFVSLHVSGVRGDAALAAELRQRWCDALTDAEFTRFAAHQRNADYWLVLAGGDATQAMGDTESIRAEVLRHVNDARARKRRCGTRSFPPAPPLRLDALLNRAAATHAGNMAKHRKLQHEGFDGSTPGERARAAGYAWRAVGENIAAGPTTAKSVVRLWLDSPGHCANLMSADYTEMGIAFAVDRQQASGVYWAQTLGRPR
jgi:uncharacterized protein YkwD